MSQPLREYRAIGAFVRLLSVEGRDGLAIMAAKAVSQFALDPENFEAIKLSGALIPLINLLHSSNEFVLIQVCGYVSTSIVQNTGLIFTAVCSQCCSRTKRAARTS
jgi:hypothetical protein